MDFMKAVQYPFDDPDWLKKLGIAVALILLNLVPVIGTLAYVILLQGWGYQTTKNVKGNVPNPLAGWDDFGGLFSKGLTLFLAGLVYSIPIVIFLCIGYLPLIAAGIISDSGGSSDAAGAIGSLGFLMIFCGYCFSFVYLLISGVIFWGGYIRYIDREEFGTFMQFGENLAIVRKNMSDFLMALLFVAGASVLGSLASSITLGLGGFLIGTFMAYFSSHILGQLAAKIGGAPAPQM